MSVQVPQEIKDKLNLTQKDINDIVYKFRKGKSK
jgi:hypothetical protein